MTDISLPVTFRSQLIGEMMRKLRAGESCSLIGVGSSGKSNVVRHLLRQDVRELHLGAVAPRVVYLYVDCGKLSRLDAQDLYALVLEVLAKTLPQMDAVGSTLAPRVDEWWQQTTLAANEAITRHNLERALTTTFNDLAMQVIVALDDCDTLVRQATPALWRGLRALRDDFKLKLVYITVTRQELVALHPANTPEFEAFFELLSSHQIPVPPYNEEDATAMLRRLSSRGDSDARPLTDVEIKRLYQITGGHAGLIKVAYSATNRGERALAPDLIPFLDRQRVICDEGGKIVESLDQDEVADLTAIARKQPPTHGALKRLRKKGLVVDDVAGQPAIFSPLFRDYLASQPAATTEPARAVGLPPVSPDANTSSVTVAGKTIALTPVEFAIFVQLYQAKPAPCPRGDLLAQVMTIKTDPLYAHGHPNQRLENCIHQLKAKLDPPGNSYFGTTPEGGIFFNAAGQ